MHLSVSEALLSLVDTWPDSRSQALPVFASTAVGCFA